MKTFAVSAILMAAFAAAKDLPTTDVDTPEYQEEKIEEGGVDGDDVDMGLEPDLETEETWEEYWARLDDEMLMARLGWQGVYQGLYGIAGEEEAPTDDCFGDWIPDKMKEVSAFRDELKTNWMVDMDMAATAAYDVVDLIFLNDKYCHFRKVLWDVHNFCLYSESCSSDMVFENMQKNAFNIITQVSSTASIMKQQKWEDMDTHHKAYTLNQMGKSMASLFKDLVSFDPENIPEGPPEEPEDDTEKTDDVEVEQN